MGPLLFLLYVLPLGRIIQSYSDLAYHLYRSFMTAEVYQMHALINCLSQVKQWLIDNFHQLNPTKTETLTLSLESLIANIRDVYWQDYGDTICITI